MIALMDYPKDTHARGKITPYLKRLHLTTRHLTIVEGTKEELNQFKAIVLRNKGKIVLDVRIVMPKDD